jgi:hypothetical protein
MSKLRFAAMMSILFALTLASSAARAEGCSCLPDPFQKRWDAADAVFTATVIQIDELTKYIRKGNANDIPVNVLLKVDESFKGTAAKPGHGFELQTSLTKDTCTGHPFVKGKEYLIFAYQRSENAEAATSLYNMPAGSWDVGGLCGGTKDISTSAASDEIALIRKKLADKPEEKATGLMDRMFGN